MNSKTLNKSEYKEIKAHLYETPSAVKNLDFEELASYLKTKTPFKKVDVRPPPRDFEGPSEDLAQKFARSRVGDPENPKTDSEPLYGEIIFEKRLLQNQNIDIVGILYDGFQLSRIFRELLPRDEANLSHIHIIFTNRLFGTLGKGDCQYHARVAVYDFPTLISTTGIVEAPAKPKEFYRKKQQYASLGQTAGALEELKSGFEGRFVDYDDERLTEIMKGYVMQAVFYYLAESPFCDKEFCRLYNAHWQEKVLQAQLQMPEFCQHHQKMIKNWKKGTSRINKSKIVN